MQTPSRHPADPRPGVLAAIGSTPLVRLDALAFAPDHTLYAKLEGLNPGGSSKDRSAMKMIAGAMARGEVRTGGTVIESSSGNMGIGLALICARLRLRFICVTDARTTATNLRLMQLYGAQVEVVTPDERSGKSLLEQRLSRGKDLLLQHPGSYWPNQYANQDNPAAHRDTMREIVEALADPPDFVFCPVSTCGTLLGCSQYIAEHALPTQLVAVDSIASSIFGEARGMRLIPGLGAAIVPALFQQVPSGTSIRVSDSECIASCRSVLAKESLLVGGSSGAVVAAYMKQAPLLNGRRACVLIFPDRGERYLDTIFSDEWVERNGLSP